MKVHVYGIGIVDLPVGTVAVSYVGDKVVAHKSVRAAKVAFGRTMRTTTTETFGWVDITECGGADANGVVWA